MKNSDSHHALMMTLSYPVPLAHLLAGIIILLMTYVYIHIDVHQYTRLCINNIHQYVYQSIIHSILMYIDYTWLVIMATNIWRSPFGFSQHATMTFPVTIGDHPQKKGQIPDVRGLISQRMMLNQHLFYVLMGKTHVLMVKSPSMLLHHQPNGMIRQVVACL